MKNILTNKIFWYGLGGLILLYILYRNWSKIKQFFGKDYGVYSSGGGTYTPAGIPDGRKGELETLAKELYDKIYGVTTFTDKETSFIKANSLNDTELKYLAQYYKSALTRSDSLYHDVDSEWMPFSSEDENLLARLSALNEQ
jgi:hypothetical protein